MINLSSVVLSPMLSQQVVINRQSGTWVKGRFLAGEKETITTTGIVTKTNTRDLSVVPEGDRQGGGIRVLTTIPVYVTGQNEGENLADTVSWEGDTYKIVSVDPDQKYGFYRAICVRIPGGES
nr:MAG TPA: Minor capsid protein [Caudoviricetes sp.]